MRSNLILAVIAALLAIPTSLSYLADADVFTDYTDIQRMFPGFTEDKVNAVALRKPVEQSSGLPGMPATTSEPRFDQLNFIKRNDRWVVFGGDLDGAPINEQMLEERVFRHVRAVRKDPEAIIFPQADADTLLENHLTPETGFGIKCVYQDMQTALGGARRPPATLAELYVGKEARNGSYTQEAVPGFLVRKSDDKDVVLYEVPFWERPMDVNDWLDKNVHQFPAGDVVHFSLNNDKVGAPVVFDRKPGSEATWVAVAQPDDTGAVRQGELVLLISQYSQVQGMQWVGSSSKPGIDLPAKGLEPPVVEVSASLEDGSVRSLKVGHQVEGRTDYYAISGDLDFVRTIPGWVVDNLSRDPRHLFDPK